MALSPRNAVQKARVARFGVADRYPSGLNRTSRESPAPAMITPRFTVTQDDEFVIVVLETPHIKVGAAATAGWVMDVVM